MLDSLALRLDLLVNDDFIVLSYLRVSEQYRVYVYNTTDLSVHTEPIQCHILNKEGGHWKLKNS